MIVATPGRIIDLMEKGIANVSQCHMLVLDEADKLLSMDYQKALDKLISYLPSDRQVLLYSATFPITIRGFTVSTCVLVICTTFCTKLGMLIKIHLQCKHVLKQVATDGMCTITLASSPGHTQLFQRMHEKSGRAWYQKSRAIRHHTKGEN